MDFTFGKMGGLFSDLIFMTVDNLQSKFEVDCIAFKIPSNETTRLSF
jgi:hypothetical protein